MHIARSLGRRAALKDMRVLVVEGDALVAMVFEDELRGAGAEVVGPALCVGEAVRLVEASVADGAITAAVLDINIGGKRVSPVADRLAALGVPFLFAAGYDEAYDTGRHRAAPTLRKPFAPGRLLAAIEALAPTAA